MRGMHPLSYLLDILHEEFIKEGAATATAWLKQCSQPAGQVRDFFVWNVGGRHV
jgi:hypothetical protein